MKKSIFILFSCLLMIYINGCEKDDSTDFVNKLTLGTGLDPTNAFKLSRESTTFNQTNGSAIIYFRLESADDMGGAKVLLDFESPDGSLINTISRPAAQNYGHIMVSSFEWLWFSGNYQIKAYLMQGNDKKFIASADFTIQ